MRLSYQDVLTWENKSLMGNTSYTKQHPFVMHACDDRRLVDYLLIVKPVLQLFTWRSAVTMQHTFVVNAGCW
jgi:hypothetical protein